MKNTVNLLLKSGLVLSILFAVTPAATQQMDKLSKIVAGQHRTAEYAARDIYRHPVETLNFFGIKDNMTVIEISPGGGWYTEILAPYLKENGHYIAAGFDPESSIEYYKNNATKFQNKLTANPELYAKTKLTIMQPPEKLNFAENNSADLVLSFRNAHGWNNSGSSEVVYAAIFKTLKPGGIFGLVQHRAGHKYPQDSSGKMGYLKQSEVIKQVEKAGFKLIDKSEINANPKDKREHEKGVWTLPPVYRLKDKDREKYLAIGESDRMTLKFVKPHTK